MQIIGPTIFQQIGRWIRNTPVEVAALAILGASVLSYVAYNNESQRAATLRVSYSVAASREQEAWHRGEERSVLNSYLAIVNDATMDVFDAWNTAYNGKNPSSQKFASELEGKIRNPTLNAGPYTLAERLGILPSEAARAREELS